MSGNKCIDCGTSRSLGYYRTIIANDGSVKRVFVCPSCRNRLNKLACETVDADTNNGENEFPNRDNLNTKVVQNGHLFVPDIDPKTTQWRDQSKMNIKELSAKYGPSVQPIGQLEQRQ